MGTFSTASPSSLAPLKCLSFPDVPATVFYGLIKKYCRHTETPTLLLHITPSCWINFVDLLANSSVTSSDPHLSGVLISLDWLKEQFYPPWISLSISSFAPPTSSFCKPLTPFPCGDESSSGGEAWIFCFLSQHGVKMAHTYIKPHTSAHATLCWGSMWSDVTGSPIKSTKRSSLRGFRCSKLPLINLNEHYLPVTVKSSMSELPTLF